MSSGRQRVGLAKIRREQELGEERKVVGVLRTRAKDHIELIAKECGFSSQKVSRIITRLERSHRIWGCSAILDEESLGLRHFYMFMSRTKVPLTKKEVETILFTRVDEIVSSQVFIENIEYLHGSFDFLISFYAKDTVPAKRFLEAFNTLYNSFVQNLTLCEGVYPVRQRGIRNPTIKKTLYLPLVDGAVDLKELSEKQ